VLINTGTISASLAVPSRLKIRNWTAWLDAEALARREASLRIAR
jgi:hypothetical protein